mmetsp:Transcript_19672/g.27663  ORF Transcript_19672/g.27663 Transcript_19672/m.27663 type:complete len:163 (+) Transcript_19672:818-1306(+)
MMGLILREMMQFERDRNTEDNEDLPKNSFILCNPSNNSQTNLYIQIPAGTLKSSYRNFGRCICDVIKWRAKKNKMHHDEEARMLISKVETEYSSSFLTVANSNGYSTLKSPKISPQFWIAMSDAANLKIAQQRILKQYLSYHLGHRIVVSDNQLRHIGSDFV